MIKLSVVIGTFNQKETLKLTLESYYKQTLSPNLFEVIVVDSSSTDGTADMIRALPPPPFSLKYLCVPNKGKPSARNLGIDQAVGAIILLADADMLAGPNLLKEHLIAQELKPASYEGMTINPDTKPYIKEKVKPGQKLKWSYFLSGNLSLSRDSLVKAGKFDEAFTSYGWEDIELGYRLSLMGVPLYYLPSAINYHNHETSDEDILQRKYAMGQSAAIFLKKHPNQTIRYYLGLNPIANFIYKFLKRHPRIVKHLSKYFREEYNYRAGLESKLGERFIV